MKRIAIDTVFLNRRYSGISIVWYSLLKYLKPEGYEIIIFKRENSYLPPEILKKYKIVRVKNFIGEFEDIPYINSLCLFNNVSYFISTYYTYATAVPCLVWVYDMIPEIFGYDFSTPMWAQKRRCFINGKYFVGISQTTRKDFKHYYPSKPRSYLNFCGLDTQRFKNEDFSIIKKLQINKPFFILIATNTDAYKNAATLIKLFISHPDLLDDFDFICLSDKFIQNPGIKWVSRLSNAELTSLYRNCEGLIQPSLYEGFGYPVIEAMYHKKNVLAYKSPATHEIGIDHCIYFNSVDELRNKIYEIHKDEHKDKIEGGYSRAVSFSPESQSGTFNQIINDIV